MRAIGISALCLWAAVTAGCASKPMSVAPEFWDHPENKVAVVLARLPEQGRTCREGAQGLLDIVITEAMDPGEARCARILKADRFRNVQEIFQKELERAGLHATVYAEEIDLAALPKGSRQRGCYERDLGEVFQETGSDTIVLLQLTGFGTARTYHGFIPQSAPKGYAVARGLMIEKSEHRILWDSGESEGVIREPVIGPWSQEPNFPNLSGAAERALEKSKKFLLERFFEERLSPQGLALIDMHAGETPEQKALAELIARYLQGMETTRVAWMSCSKPYRMTQNCSFRSCANLRISMDGVEGMIAGSEDGTIVLVQGLDASNDEYSWQLDSAFGAIVTTLEAQKIHITKVVGVTGTDGKFGAYYLFLDQDGYSLLRPYAVSKE